MWMGPITPAQARIIFKVITRTILLPADYVNRGWDYVGISNEDGETKVDSIDEVDLMKLI